MLKHWKMADIKEEILQAKICPYCGNEPEYVDSRVIYGKSYGMIYLCRPCDAYVGVHHGTTKAPLGRLANKRLRSLKKKAHKYFDKIWKNKLMSRTEAYTWLAGRLCIPKNECHIGMFDEYLCEKTIKFCKQIVE